MRVRRQAQAERDSLAERWSGEDAPGADRPLIPGGPHLSLERDPASGRRRITVAAMLVLVVALSAAGILVGRALRPATTTVPVTTAAAPTTTAAKPIRHHPPAVLRLGPLRLTVAARFPPGATAGAATLAASTLIVLGGRGNATLYAGAFSGRLTTLAALPSSRGGAALFSVGGVLYVLGGESGATPTAAILRLASGNARLSRAGSFEEPLAESGLVEHGNAVYLLGGWTGSKYATAILRITPPATASLVARLPVGLRWPAVARIGSVLYVAGGASPSGISRRVVTINLQSGAVSTLAELPAPVEHASLLIAGGELYLAGGKGPGGAPASAVVEIDPRSGHARQVGRLSVPLVGATPLSVGSTSYLVDAARGLVYRVG